MPARLALVGRAHFIGVAVTAIPLYFQRPGMPVVAASLVIGSGGDANPTGRSGLANFTAAMLNQGTASRNTLTLANDIAQPGARISASSSKDAITVSLPSLKSNLPSAIDLLADVALRPSFPKDEVERQRRSRLASLVAQRQDPQTVASTVTLAMLYGPSHRYGHIELGNESAIRATVREDMEAFWKRTLVPGNAALIVSGAIGERELKPLVEKAFGAWPAAGRRAAASRGARVGRRAATARGEVRRRRRRRRAADLCRRRDDWRRVLDAGP